MSNVTLNDLTSSYGSQALLNSNFQTIEDALNNDVLYRTGTEANAMQRSLDMNSNKLINVADGVANTDGVSLAQLNGAIGASSSGLIASQTESQKGSAVSGLVTTFVGIVYTVGANNLEVYRNGNRQSKTRDYSETSISSITWIVAPNATDDLDFRTNTATTNSTTTTAAITHTVNSSTANLETHLQNQSVVNIKDFGAIGDGTTDDTVAIQAAIDSFTTTRGGAIFVPIGVYKHSVGLSLSQNGLRIYGECWRNSVLWYSGTGVGITINTVACEVDHLHLTSLDPATSGHLVNINAGTGSAETGILLKHVDTKIHNNTICYFNDASVMAAAIKTSGINCFSNSIHDNYIRYNWGGIELKETVTDMTVYDNTILDVEKYGVSLGYNWKTATQNTFIGDNYRIQGNLIQNVNKNFNPGGGVGDGYGVYLSVGAVISVEDNYIEDVVAQGGFNAYGVFGDGVTSNKLLMLSINKNNLVTNFGGTSFSIFLDNMSYCNGEGNHLESGSPSVSSSSTATFIKFGNNFFTGAPSTPYSLLGASSYYEDLPTNNGMAGSRYDFHNEILFRGGYRSIITTFSDADATPNVLAGNIFKTANTGSTTITGFDGISSGKSFTVIISDANTTVDFTGTSLKGNAGVDWSPAVNDHMTCVYDGTNYYCDISDNTV